jgi:hypothetical protein
MHDPTSVQFLSELIRGEPELISTAIPKEKWGIGKATMGSLIAITWIVIPAEGHNFMQNEAYLLCFLH